MPTISSRPSACRHAARWARTLPLGTWSCAAMLAVLSERRLAAVMEVLQTARSPERRCGNYRRLRRSSVETKTLSIAGNFSMQHARANTRRCNLQKLNACPIASAASNSAAFAISFSGARGAFLAEDSAPLLPRRAGLFSDRHAISTESRPCISALPAQWINLGQGRRWNGRHRSINYRLESTCVGIHAGAAFFRDEMCAIRRR